MSRTIPKPTPSDLTTEGLNALSAIQRLVATSGDSLGYVGSEELSDLLSIVAGQLRNGYEGQLEIARAVDADRAAERAQYRAGTGATTQDQG